jgi:hypothetical protein
VLVAVTFATWAHIATHVIAAHLHAGFCAWAWMTAISTIRPAVRKCRTREGSGSNQCCGAEDRWEIVPNAAEARRCHHLLRLRLRLLGRG